ncbi:hypothetical protein ACS0TY_028400 [Phlomoides rotata]
MWRPLARRVLLCRRTAAPELRIPVNLQVLTRPLSSPESASRFSHSSRISHFHQNPRFFSSNSTENHEDLPYEKLSPVVNEIGDGFDFSGMDILGGNTNSEFENGDVIFNDASDNVEGSQGVGEFFDDSVVLNENLDSVEESIGEVKTNDLEAVERLLSLMQSSGIVDGSIETHFEEMDLVLEEDLVLKVLETPFIPAENLMSFFKWALKKPEFKLTTRVLDSFVRVICAEKRKREVYGLWDLINEVGKKEVGLVSTESLNELIAKFSILGKGKAAFDVFSAFEEFGCVCNADTYYLTIEAVCRRSFNNWAQLVCEKMLSADLLPDAEKVGKIITLLCKGGMEKDAHLIYLYAKDKKINLSQTSVNFLVCSLSKIEKTKSDGKEINKFLERETISLALEMLNDYSAEDRKRAVKPFSSVIEKLCWIEDVERAKKLLLEMVHSGPPPGNAVFNFVINGLTKNGEMEEALKIKKLMESRGLKPDVYAYTVIMSGYVRGEDMVEACKIYEEAKLKHTKLTPAAYHSLIRGFCKLEQYDKAVNLLGEMRQHGIRPSHDEYNKLIKSLCFKALDWETAEKLEVEMRENGVILNSRTRALISAVKELQVEEGTEIADEVI